MRRLWASTRCPRELTGRFYDYEGNAPIDGAKRYYLIQSGVLVIQDSYGLRVNEILVDNTLDDSRIIKKGGRVVETQGIIFHWNECEAEVIGVFDALSDWVMRRWEAGIE